MVTIVSMVLFEEASNVIHPSLAACHRYQRLGPAVHRASVARLGSSSSVEEFVLLSRSDPCEPDKTAAFENASFGGANRNDHTKSSAGVPSLARSKSPSSVLPPMS